MPYEPSGAKKYMTIALGLIIFLVIIFLAMMFFRLHKNSYDQMRDNQSKIPERKAENFELGKSKEFDKAIPSGEFSKMTPNTIHSTREKNLP